MTENIKSFAKHVSRCLVLVVFCFAFEGGAVASSGNSSGNSSKVELPQENLIFRIPGLDVYYPARYSWAIGRGQFVWVQGEELDLAKVAWPKWDIAQDPAALVGTRSKKFYVRVWPDSTSLPSDIKVGASWDFENYLKEGKTIDRYALVAKVSDSVELRGPVRKPALRKSLFRCRIPINLKDSDFDKNEDVKSCFRTIEGLKKVDTQWYVNFFWPKFRQKEILRYSMKKERSLLTLLKRAGHRVSSERRGKTKYFEVEAGRTKVEDIVIEESIDFSTLKNFEIIAKAPSDETKRVLLHEVEFGENLLRIFAAPNDEIKEGALKSSSLGRETFLQFVRAPKETQQAYVQTSDYPEYVTGVQGQLHHAQVEVGTSFNSLLSSSRESDAYMGVGYLAGSYRLPWQRLTGSFLFQKDLLRYGSLLSITELQVKLDYAPEFMGPFSFYTGWLGYSLSGRNEGANRLGGYQGIPIGIGYYKLTLPYVWRSQVGMIYGLSGTGSHVGAEARFSLDKMLTIGAMKNFHVGVFGTFAFYKANLLNTSNNILQAFSETRFQIGLNFGWIGAGYMRRVHETFR